MSERRGWIFDKECRLNCRAPLARHPPVERDVENIAKVKINMAQIRCVDETPLTPFVLRFFFANEGEDLIYFCFVKDAAWLPEQKIEF